MNTALEEKRIGLLEIMLKDKRIEILVEKRGEKYKYYQMKDNEKLRFMGISHKNPEDFSNLIEKIYQSRGIKVDSKNYYPNLYSTN